MTMTIEAPLTVGRARPVASGRLPAVHPFSLHHAATLLRRFPGSRGDVEVDSSERGEALYTALAIDRRRFGLRVFPDPVGVGYEVYGDQMPGSGDHEEIRWAIDRWLSLSDDLTGFYRLAGRGDPRFAAVVEAARGLHRVCYPTLAEAVVSHVLAADAEWPAVLRMKRRLVAEYGGTVVFNGHAVTTFPEFADLLHIETREFAELLDDGCRAGVLVSALHAMVALGPEWLRTVPYDEAEEALLRVRGIGKRLCEGILEDGLGRMEGLRSGAAAHPVVARWYGRGARDAIRAYYGRHIGYWGYYLVNCAS
ncbi:3-methyladenine DNA glycosylase/8-oxoguanine DNA glycosylase [Catenulispora sp. GAS73]|uniref:hypothetical protein n=1 Tax=Catenulispora sp. GAS73 TaxID=3156269 RepID=UPI003514549B